MHEWSWSGCRPGVSGEAFWVLDTIMTNGNNKYLNRKDKQVYEYIKIKQFVDYYYTAKVFAYITLPRSLAIKYSFLCRNHQ